MQLRKFSAAKKAIIASDEIECFLQDVSKKLSNNSKDQKKYLQVLKQLYVQQEENIQHLSHHPEKITALLNYFSHLLKRLASTKLNKRVTGAALLSFLGKATAQPSSDLTVITGPAAGNDLCSGFINCMQGYLANQSGAVVASFNMFLDLAGQINLGAVWAFNSCMDVNRVGNFLKDILAENGTDILGEVTSACSVNYNMAGGSSSINLGSQVQNLPPVPQCLAYQNSFLAESQLCMSDGRVIGLNAAITFIILGAILCCAIPFLICKFCMPRSRCC